MIRVERRVDNRRDHRRSVAPRRFTPLPGLAALCLPGLGHWLLGEHRRAVMIALGVGFLFFGGLFIGGIDAVDSFENRGWFFAQLPVGPLVLLTDRAHQAVFQIETHPFTGVEAIGRAGEIGTLYTASAGIMNLIAVLDAAFWRPRPARRVTDV